VPAALVAEGNDEPAPPSHHITSTFFDLLFLAKEAAAPRIQAGYQPLHVGQSQPGFLLRLRRLKDLEIHPAKTSEPHHH
jgi:hypothetical protein